MKFHLPFALILLGLANANAALISEFQPNPVGNDPATQSVEISGTAGMAFTGYTLFTLETDGAAGGTVDRAFTFDGMFDVNGLFVVDIPDLENPSFVFGLSTTGFTAMVGDDLDDDDDGTFKRRH